MRNLDLKLDLRRRALKAAGFKKLRVLDLFPGDGAIWKILRAEFDVEIYLPCDLNPRAPVCFSTPPLFIEAIARDRINVVDADLAGEPWELWAAIARRLTRPAVVFLSDMPVKAEGQPVPISSFALDMLGIPRNWPLPEGRELAKFSAEYFIARSFANLEIGVAWRAPAGKTNYFALLAKPAEEAQR